MNRGKTKAAPEAMGGSGAAREKTRVGSEGGPRDPCPPLGTPYPKRGLARIGRKGSKSTVSRPERRTKGPGPRRTPAQ